MIAVLCRVDLRNKGLVKGELKTKIINFSNIFFGKPNIRKVKFVELFLPFSCYMRENNTWSWAFPAFFGVFIAGSKTRSAACSDVWYGEERFCNQVKQGKHKCCCGYFLYCFAVFFTKWVVFSHFSFNQCILLVKNWPNQTKKAKERQNHWVWMPDSGTSNAVFVVVTT